MTSPTLRWWLGLDGLPTDLVDRLGSARIVFERPLPGWGWFLVLVGCAALAWWSYRRLRGPLPARIALGTLRGGVVLLLAVLLAGPSLRVARETVEKDWIMVLVDRSRSMTIRDEATPTGRQAREDTLLNALKQATPAFERLAASRTVVWLGFAGGAFDLSGSGESAAVPGTLGEPAGDRTRLDDALRQALQRAAARPLAGIVLLTDGRTSAAPSRATLRALEAEAAPVIVVPLGSETPQGDLAIARVDSPGRAFLNDEVPIRVEIERSGAGRVPPDAKARLIDVATGTTIAETAIPPIEPGAPAATVTLLPKPSDAGVRDWRVELDAGSDDLVAENNARPLRIELVDRPLRVLYVEGYPRWEYRYLKNLLIREATIDSSIMLLSADRDFAQEGNMPIGRLPRSSEEFALFDLIILGDVPAGFFTPEQLEMIRDQVAERGTGLLWVGGERSTPSSWEETALVDLLPMRPPLAFSAVPVPVNLLATPAAASMGLLKVGDSESWPAELADPRIGWSRLEWTQQIPFDQLKPTAEVLATGRLVSGDPASAGELDGDQTPVIMAMKYGAGEIVYVATDEIWRWRYGRGERYTEQVWLPLVRMLGREALSGSDDGVTLRAIPSRVQLGQSVRIELDVLDAKLVDRTEGGVSAEIIPQSGSDARPLEVELVRTGRPGEYAASVAPETAGSHLVRITGGLARGAEAAFECERPDDETRSAAADHELIRGLAAATGGRVLAAGELARLPELLPDRSVRTEQATVEPIWDAPLALVALVLLASLEWLGRRWMRLA